ncbi:shikimate dehydrogenase [Ornithinibacillus bavariensis]|uniref:shikimate dehydrogenase n=1 Tax=Ornithinibacillus bavariensis TaxID=545502 RepID=UPI000ED52001|nr:shikimate dehydrogenase [Ornithinibacillus sp.]
MELRLGLIGYPIKHSLSPWIHKRFMQQTNIEGTYRIEEVLPDEFEQQITRIIHSYDGFNVTVPYKQKIISYLDELDENAAKIGSVNTVINVEGRLIGYNTDGIGYVRSLESSFPEIMEKKKSKILIIGAGGAARGIYVALNQCGFQFIDIANRTKEKAEAIAKLRKKPTTTEVIGLKQAEEHIGNYPLIVQTTSVGMLPNQDMVPIQLHHLPKKVNVSDIIYQPFWTKFLKEANDKGANIHHGHTMLLYQAQYAFEIWTGIRPSLGNMNRELKLLLEG